MPRARMNGGVTGYFNLPTGSSAGGIWSATEENLYRGNNLFPLDSTGGDPQFNLTSLLLHGDGSNGANNSVFQDSSATAATITRNGTPTQGTFSPFSQTGWSNYFNGSTDYLQATVTGSGTGDFTIEGWAYATTLASGAPNIFSIVASGSSTGFQVYMSSSQGFGIRSNTSNILINAGSITPLANTWYHLAMVRKTGTISLYVNGVLAASTSSAYTFSDTQFNVGYTSIGSYFAGYISNVRYVNGTAIYNSNFTPSTTPLTAITNTVLLTCQSNRFLDNSTNAYTITPSGTPSVQPFSPLPPAAAYGVSSVGGSAYFNQANPDYLMTSYSTGNNFTGNFTIEAWVYCLGVGTPGFGILANQGFTTSGGSGVSIFFDTSGRIAFFVNGNGTIAYSANNTVSYNQWYHVALVRLGSTNTLYLNGVSVATNTATPTWPGATAFGIGRTYNDNTGYQWSGYISNLRVVNGTAVYTSAFTPPTAPVTAIAATQLLINGTNAGIYDQTAKNDLITVGSAQISTTQSKFGGSSILFNGSTDYITTPSYLNWQFGTGDFTIEAWVWKSANGTNGYDGVAQYGSATNASDGWYFEISSSRGLYFTINGSTVTYGTWTNDSTWHHVAVVRSSGIVTIYKDGTSVASGSLAGSVPTTGTVGRIGSTYNGTTYYYYNGYIDDLRITKGYARYTSAFTPLLSAFPNR